MCVVTHIWYRRWEAAEWKLLDERIRTAGPPPAASAQQRREHARLVERVAEMREQLAAYPPPTNQSASQGAYLCQICTRLAKQSGYRDGTLLE